MTENGAAKQNELYQGVHKASTAYKLLASMGWKEGQGLGAQKQGITSHVKVKKKFDSTGVGMAEKHDRQRDWTIGMVAFDRILSGLKEVAARHDSSDESDDDTAPAKASTSSSSSDSEQEARPAKKAKAKGKQAAVQKKKGKRAKEPTPSDSSEESSSSSSSSSEDEDVAKRSPAPSKLATHVGRYHKRERAKSVRGYSAGDLAAILGAAPGGDGADTGGPVWEPPSVAAKDSDESSLMPLDPVEEEEEDEVPAGGSKAGQDAEGGAPARFWWSGMFVRAGRMGSTRHELHSKKVTAAAAAAAGGSGAAIKITGFSEQDQENLYTQAHLGATHNKQGLGKADAPKKVAGARWQGTKIRLDSDSDEDEAQEGGSGGDSDSSSDDEVPGAVVVMASKKEQAEGHVAKEVLMLPPAKPAARAGAVGKVAAAKGAEKGAKGEGEKGEKKRKREEKKVEEEEAPQAKAGKKGTAGKKDKSKGDKEEAPKVKAEKGGKGKAENTQKVDKVEKEGKRVSKDEQQEVVAEGKVQWKKLAKQVLKAAPKQRLKVDLFKQQVLQAAGLGEAIGSDMKLMKKIKASPELFEVGDKFVKLL